MPNGPNPDLLRHPGLLVPFLQSRVQRDGVGQGGKPWAMLVPYIDARAAAAILDRALGVGGWSFKLNGSPTVTPGGKGMMVAGRLTLHLGGDPALWPSYDGVGTAGGDAIDTGVAGCASSALKRAATLAGVGRAIYQLGERFAPDGTVTSRDKGGKTYVNVSDRGHAEAIKAWQAELSRMADAYQAKLDAGDQPTPEATDLDVEQAARASAAATDGAPVVNPETGEVHEDQRPETGGDARAHTEALREAMGAGVQEWPDGWDQDRVTRILAETGEGSPGERFTALRLALAGDRDAAVEACGKAGLDGPAALGTDQGWAAALVHADLADAVAELKAAA
jgi:hypothetical protein